MSGHAQWLGKDMRRGVGIFKKCPTQPTTRLAPFSSKNDPNRPAAFGYFPRHADFLLIGTAFDPRQRGPRGREQLAEAADLRLDREQGARARPAWRVDARGCNALPS
eukprot:6206588-Pleurochrysis_carterae.AAC.1